MGSVPSARANVAFSLYGVLKGERDKGCRKKSFINSFHTTEGVESFTNAMYAAGLSNLFTFYDGEDDDAVNYDLLVTSTCHEMGDDRDLRRRSLNEDGNYGNGGKYSNSIGSYGLGCTTETDKHGFRQFAMYDYLGEVCDANAIVETMDELEAFNEKMELSMCVPIYTDGDYYNNDDEDNKDDEDYSSPLALLKYSRSCRVTDGTNSCPDPYGKLRTYERNLAVATGAIEAIPYWHTYNFVMSASWAMIGMGILAFLVGMAILISDCCCMPITRKKFRRSRKLKKKKKKQKQIEDANRELYREESMLKDAQEFGTRTHSNLSAALSAASAISEDLARSLGLSKSDRNKKPDSKRSLQSSSKKPDSKRSLRSKSPNKKPDSKRSLRSKSPDKKPRSNRTLRTVERDEEDKQHGVIPHPSMVSVDTGTHFDTETGSHTSHLSHTDEGSVTDGGSYLGKVEKASATVILATAGAPKDTAPQDDDASAASASVQAVNKIVNYFKNENNPDAPGATEQDLFSDESMDYEEDNSVEMRIPDSLPHSTPADARGKDEAEVESGWTQEEEAVSKKKWRKRKWLRKLVGNS